MLIVKIKFNPVTTETDLYLDPAKKIFFIMQQRHLIPLLMKGFGFQVFPSLLP